MPTLTQYGQRPFQVFTIDDAFSARQIADWERLVAESARDDVKIRHSFPNNPTFRNGQIRRPNVAWDIFAGISHVFAPGSPAYFDGEGSWADFGFVDYIMYSEADSERQLGLHPDRGYESGVNASRVPKFTVLVYLTDGFEGGGTALLLDDDDDAEGGGRNPRTVLVPPRRNRALVFDASLSHSSQCAVPTRWIGTEITAKLR